MTRHDLRTKVVEGANRLLNHALVLGVDFETRSIVEAQRNLFATDDRALEQLYLTLPPALRSE